MHFCNNNNWKVNITAEPTCLSDHVEARYENFSVFMIGPLVSPTDEHESFSTTKYRDKIQS